MEIFPNLPSLIFHVVFSTRGQAPLITAEIGILLYSYLDGLIQSEGGMVIESGGMPDHIHLLASFSHEKSAEERTLHQDRRPPSTRRRAPRRGPVPPSA